jgi:hypothetical protein
MNATIVRATCLLAAAIATQSGLAQAAEESIAIAEMPRYCALEAASKFQVSPSNVTTESAKHTQGMYEVWGQYPAKPSPQVFICSFNAERQFLSVDKYQP